METRLGYLLAVNVGIGSTIIFWIFLLIFVGKAMSVLTGTVTGLSNQISSQTDMAIGKMNGFAADNGLNTDIAFSAAAQSATTVLQVTISVMMICSLIF